MPKVDMSAPAVTARLRLISQLRKLALSLQKAKIRDQPDEASTDRRPQKEPNEKPK
jgi:hypothetical protein